MKPTVTIADTVRTWKNKSNQISDNVGNPEESLTGDTLSLVSALNLLRDNTILANSIIGDLSGLSTTDKSTLVAAVNEVHSDLFEELQTIEDSANLFIASSYDEIALSAIEVSKSSANIGSLPSLLTANKTSLVAAVNEIDGGTPIWTMSALDHLGIHGTTGIVDAFIYNTANDSDGGAWRNRCQTKSWYNETLNTATRGSKREFPAVVLIVAKSTSVTIYDMTEKDLPMWMVFNNTIFSMIGQGDGTYITAAVMLNGVLTLSNNYPGEIVAALPVINFIKDSAFCYAHYGTYYSDYPNNCGFWVGGIIKRNTTTPCYTGGSATLPAIVSANCNDVAMTVIPGAPIDVLTGLPVATIAVATAGGVSIIDGYAGVGTVVDDVYTPAPVFYKIAIEGDRLVSQLTNSWAYAPLSGYLTDTTSATVNGWNVNRNGKIFYNISGVSHSIPAIILAAPGQSYSAVYGAGGGLNGLSLINEKITSYVNSMVAHITKDYNTGWMKGDVRRAFLCDAKKSANIIVNGTFDTAIGLEWDGVGTISSYSAVNGELQINLSSGDYGGVIQLLPTIIGRRYKATCVGRRGTTVGDIVLQLGTATQNTASAVNIALTVEWVAIATETQIALYGTGGAGTCFFDNVIVTEVIGNLVLNGDFTSNTDSWTLTGTGSVASVAGECALTYVSGTDVRLTQVIQTVPGKQYTITAETRKGTCTGAQVYIQNPGDGLVISTTSITAAAGALVFTAAASTVVILLRVYDAGTAYFDNVTFTELSNLESRAKVWKNFSESYAYETLTQSVGNITSAINTAGLAAAGSNGLALVVGRKYSAVIRLTLNSGTAPAFSMGAFDNAAIGDIINYILVPGTNLIQWTCSSSYFSTAWIWQHTGLTTNFSADITICEEALLDHSVKDTRFSTSGTLTRSPVATGAELQAISGFSASNYLRQAYSADLDFGTGDFYICGWLSEAPNSTREYIIVRENWNGSAYIGSFISVTVETPGTLRLAISDDALVTSDLVFSTSTIDNTNFTFFCCVRRTSNIEIWINGVKDGDVVITNATGSLSNAAAIMSIGAAKTAGIPDFPLTSGGISLLRMGVGSPSKAQIEKMYADELPLFQPYAKCTLQGSSNSVNALDYDRITDILSCGTPDGVTEFQGLKVNNFLYDNQNVIALSADNRFKIAASADAVEVEFDYPEMNREIFDLLQSGQLVYDNKEQALGSPPNVGEILYSDTNGDRTWRNAGNISNFYAIEDSSLIAAADVNDIEFDVANLQAYTVALEAKSPYDVDEFLDYGNAGTALTLNCALYDTHFFVCNQATLTLTALTLAIGRVVNIIVVNGGNCNITWPVGTQCPDGIKPQLTANRDRLVMQRIGTGIIHLFLVGSNYS